MRQSTCLVCGSSRLARLFDRLGYSVCQCQDCKLRFLDPQPDDGTLSAIYTVDYFLGERTPESEARVGELKRATASLYLDLLVDHLGGMTGRLLEIGCGTGELLLEARSRGFDISGIEVSSNAAATANRRLGTRKVTVGTLDSLAVPEAAFDVAVFTDVIEHVRAPVDFLRRVHAVLKPGGTVLLSTPSLDSWSARLLGRYWMEYKTEHLFYFRERTIRLALEAAGFTKVTMVPNAKALSFDYVYHHFERFPVPLITDLLGLGRRIMPEGVAHRQVQLVASGIGVIARKSDAHAVS